MKMKFKYVMIAAATLLLGFASCSSDDGGDGGDTTGTKDVAVKIKRPTTYAEDASAVGVVPDMKDAEVFFFASGIIKATGTMNLAEIASGKTFTGLNSGVDKVIIVANTNLLSSPAIPTTITTEAQLNAIMLDHSAQTHFQTGVNLQGSATITGTTNVTVNVDIYPAIARYEIGEIKAMPAASNPKLPLRSFKLTGIYINNTYTKVSLDYNTVSTVAAEILNYGTTATQWTDGTYPAAFKDEWAVAGVTAGSIFAPTTIGEYWSYFVMPPVANKGTTIDSELKTSVPHIILKLEDAIVEDGLAGYPHPKNPGYITITKLKKGGTYLDNLTRGEVYQIATIEIDGADIDDPEPKTKDVEVNVIVKPWVGVPVTPEI